MDHNTETLKRLSSTSEKPNNQVKLANVGAGALPPGHIKCNILKGMLFYRNVLSLHDVRVENDKKNSKVFLGAQLI